LLAPEVGSPQNECLPNCRIVNLVDRQVEVYTDPSKAGYGSRLVYAQFLSDQLAPDVIDGIEVGQIAVSDVLPEKIGASPS
jgi:hypothetical protein